jgi:hypothetical protein
MDITPTWTGILPLLLSSYEKPDERKYAIVDLQKMAELADRFVDAVNVQVDNAAAA